MKPTRRGFFGLVGAGLAGLGFRSKRRPLTMTLKRIRPKLIENVTSNISWGRMLR